MAEQNISELANDIITYLNSSFVLKGDTRSITSNTVKNLNTCISILKRLHHNENVKISSHLDKSMPSISGTDKLEIVLKLSVVIELANKLAKEVKEHKDAEKFYTIKSTGINILSNLNTKDEIAYKGICIDDKGSNAYSFEVDKYGKRAVVSWHIVGDDELFNDVYQGQDIKKYSVLDYELSSLMGIENRYNEKGMEVLRDMVSERKANKEAICGIIGENFEGIDVSTFEIERKLNGKVLEEEEDLYNIGGYSGVKVFDAIVKSELVKRYKDNSLGDIKSKYNSINSFYNSKDEEINYENIYLVARILKSPQFSSIVDFNDMLSIIGDSINNVSKLKNIYKSHSIKEPNDKNEMLQLLKMIGIDNVFDGVNIIDNISSSNIFDENSTEKDYIGFIRALCKSIGSNKDFRDGKVDGGIALESVVFHLNEKIEDGSISKDIVSNSKKLTKFINKAMSTTIEKFGEMDRNVDDNKDCISVQEVFELVDYNQFEPQKILEAVNAILEFRLGKDKGQVLDGELADVAELANEELKPRGIVELRQKLREEAYRGGGRY